jgi:uncharacterized protein
MTKNHLGAETSPYLLQHQNNPVHWHPWGKEAFAEARRSDQPLLLSIGYAACHWCHVMAHESFEDTTTANVMNANFVNVKVDREERPDVDRLYMQALHALGEQGGWPLTMFLAPDGKPFWGGTYFPPEPRHGRPSFRQVLMEISRIWQTERGKITQNTAAIIQALSASRYVQNQQPWTSDRIAGHARTILRAIDLEQGGLKGAPKFPQNPIFSFLCHVAVKTGDRALADAVTITLTHISQGGIYDHLGGGLARYATDARWLVPHFEKMLYDNGQFIALLARVWLATDDLLCRERVEETVSFMQSHMMTDDGCFTSSYDADSEGQEGKYYVWTDAEVRALLGAEEARLFCDAYDVTPQGNWESTVILNRLRDMVRRTDTEEAILKKARVALLAARAKRIPPGHDDKVLTDWNGIAITAFAEAALVFKRHDWLNAACKAFDSLLARMWINGRLHHSSRLGQTKHKALADDYACLLEASLVLHGITGKGRFLDWALLLVKMLETYHSEDAGEGFTQAPHDSNDLPLRLKHIEDDVTSNANALMIANYTKLFHVTGDARYDASARVLIEAFSSVAEQNPFAAPSLLKSINFHIDPVQLVLAGDANPIENPLLHHALRSTGLDCVISLLPIGQAVPSSHPVFPKARDGKDPALYVCRGMTCAAPATTAAAVDAALSTLSLVPKT